MHDMAGPVTENLEQVLNDDSVPAKYREWGARLLDHLRRPVRIVVTGSPGTGKSTLVNMMLAQNAVGGPAEPPVVDICYGPQARVSFDLESGEIQIAGGLLSEVEIPQGTVRACQELPIDALQWQTYRELRLDNGPETNARVLETALKEANIVLWCTDFFDAHEQGLWTKVPDIVKDHSFLVVTKADRQMMRGVLGETIGRLQPIVDEEFLGLFPVASTQAITALTRGREVDSNLWRSSGGMQLCSEIARQVELGRSADLDQAQMLLTQFARNLQKTTKPKAQRPPRPVTASPEAIQQKVDANQVLESAVKTLTRAGQTLLDALDNPESETNVDLILAKCADTISALTRLLENDASASAEIFDAQAAAREGEELMMLFQLERREDAAADAVTLLLQLKKEMSAKISA